MKKLLFSFTLIFSFALSAQQDRWQQEAEYDMEIDFDVKSNQFSGKQKIKYKNNSKDTLSKVYYHLYYNAFQPGSMMDVRSRTISDPDPRVGDRISKLTEDEIGFQKINTLKQDGKELKYFVEGTILEVNLSSPILPEKSTTLEMEFLAQVPAQIRRTGRDNKEGIRFSMSQWYPKLCEYDYQGWHANPYVGREFYGVWSDFKVKIKIDRKYTVAATGLVQNPQKMGHGYSDKNTSKKKLFGKKELEWEFKAEKVHDFVWAADPDYTHTIKMTDEGTELHYFYQENEATKDNWENLHKAMNEAEKFMNNRFGKYPYPVYAFIQGGDGGMEYPMATLITGERTYPSLVGVSIHEWMHSWYQMVLGTNESLYPWMDEGFTSFGSAEVMNHLKKKGLISGKHVDDPHFNSVRGYARFSQSGFEEPLSTHADHYSTNQAYGVASYTKGATFLQQLEYIMGTKAFSNGLKRYYEVWKFKHPNVNDFIRIMEKSSDLELDWFKEYFVNTKHTIDYAIDDVVESNGKFIVSLKKLGKMPMPIDLTIILKDGSSIKYNIPLRIMRGEKGADLFEGVLKADWPWTHNTYILEEDIKFADVKSVQIDASNRMADINLDNNIWENK